MRIVNRIVNILVLIFAITAAVFSYLLFEKREKMIDGWEKMANAIGQTAKNLDEKSGTKLAAELNASTLNHKNYNKTDLSDLENKLSNLSKGAKKIIAQRDSLAGTLQIVAKKSDVKGVTSNDLKKLSSSQAKQKFIETEISRIIQRNNLIFSNYTQHSNSLGNNLTVSELKESPEAASRSFQRAIDELRKHLKAGDATLQSIGSSIGVTPNLNSANYKDEMEKLKAGVQNMKTEIIELKRELNQERRKNNSLSSSLSSSKEQNKKAEDQLADHQKQISDLRYKLLGSPTDAELYATIQGRVENVNTRWKFIVVNLGNQMQTLKKDRVVPLMKGFSMTVVRNINTKKPGYIGRIIISQVGENYAIANIDVNSLQSEIKVGDAVYFTEDDIKFNQNLRETIFSDKK